MTRAKARRNQADAKREFPIREDDQLYARVVKMMGNGRLMGFCSDGIERLCRIRGSMIGREWIHVGDTLLIGVREYETQKADVLFKYQVHELDKLRRWGEPVSFDEPKPEFDTSMTAEDIVFEDI